MLTERCFMVRGSGYWEGIGERSSRRSEYLRTPGWLALFVSIFAMYRLSTMAWSYIGLWDILAMLLPLIAGIIFLKLSSSFNVKRKVLIRIDEALFLRDEEGVETGREQMLHVCSGEGKGMESYDVNDFTHVVFGLIDYPMPGRKSVNVESYAVYLAKEDGKSVAVVEGCFDSMSAFHLAKRISSLTGLSFIEMGKGQPFSQDIGIQEV